MTLPNLEIRCGGYGDTRRLLLHSLTSLIHSRIQTNKDLVGDGDQQPAAALVPKE